MRLSRCFAAIDNHRDAIAIGRWHRCRQSVDAIAMQVPRDVAPPRLAHAERGVLAPPLDESFVAVTRMSHGHVNELGAFTGGHGDSFMFNRCRRASLARATTTRIARATH